VRRVLEERGASGSVGTDFVLALSEIATNALVHGGPPVEARVWVGPDRLHAVVSDNGPGPDPLVGYLPVSPSPGGGIGLRLARQLTDHLAVDTRGRCVVRVTSILH
jgi:anti-sigma regulatory factor (Ser/Thr protein kinase)